MPVLLVSVASICITAASAQTPAQAYLDRLLTANAAAVADLPDYVAHAELAAALLSRDADGPGPALWLAGDKGFVTEGMNRAGGLMIAQRLPSPEDVSFGDVALVGSLEGDDAETRALVSAIAARGGLVVLFAPRPAPMVTPSAELMALLSTQDRGLLGHRGFLFLDAHADPPSASDLPTVSPANAQSLWAFSGELVSALARRTGRLTPVYRSVMVPGGREYNATLKGARWEGPAEDPPGAGVLGRTYLARVANWMRAMRATQADGFTAAGQRAAEVLSAGRTVWLATLGHLPPSQTDEVPEGELPFAILPGSQPDKVAELVRPGDLVLYVGYYEPLGPWVETVHAAGAQLVTVVSGTPEIPAAQMGADINICGCWPYGDVSVARRPSLQQWDMLPPSGVIQSAAVWMLLAETRAATR